MHQSVGHGENWDRQGSVSKKPVPRSDVLIDDPRAEGQRGVAGQQAISTSKRGRSRGLEVAVSSDKLITHYLHRPQRPLSFRRTLHVSLLSSLLRTQKPGVGTLLGGLAKTCCLSRSVNERHATPARWRVRTECDFGERCTRNVSLKCWRWESADPYQDGEKDLRLRARF